MDKYLKAIKQNVCTICVDSGEKGGCTLNEKESCALEQFLPKIVDLIHSVQTESIAVYNKLLKEKICSECRSREGGRCELRDDANCSLERYFPLVVEIIQKVDSGKIRS